MPRHVNPKISPVVRILPAPWGLPGGNWWLPLSHRVVGAPEPPSVTSVSGQETTSSICDHGGGVPRRVRGAVQKSSPPPLRPAPGSITPRGRLVRRVLLQAAPGTPGPARRKPNYCDPNLAHRRSVVEPDERCKRFWGQTDLTKHLRCHCEPRACALRSCEWRWACSKKQCRFYNHGEA